MATVNEIEKLAFELPEKQRAMLASQLLKSLPSVLEDEDEGISEAIARQHELEQNPEIGISFEELKQKIKNR
jgi:hypothetical protein